MGEHEELVGQVPLLARLAPEDLRALAARGRTRRYEPGAVIFTEGDAGDSLHIVMEGKVRVAIGSEAGEEAVLAVLGPGECLGEMSLLDGRPRSATATAPEGARTLIVPRAAFAAWLTEHPRAALALLETLSGRVRQSNARMGDLAFLGLAQRLAKRLLELTGDTHGSPGSGPHAPEKLRVTQAELAAMLGVSRESVNKQLSVFARRGLVTLGRGSVTLADATGLREVVESGGRPSGA
jgi:CRP-like cAMP-binding protein